MENELLWHYTSVDSAFNILKNKTVRMTDFRFLNDSSEFILGETILMEKLRKFNISSDSLMKKFKDVKKYGSIGILSLSTDKDSLNQWRQYADSAKGMALGFSKNRICDVLDCSLVKCQYEDHHKYINDFISKNESHIIKWLSDDSIIPTDTSGFNTWNNERDILFKRMLEVILPIKESSFKSENEVRAYKYSAIGKCNSRVNNGLITPYQELALTKNKCVHHLVDPTFKSAVSTLSDKIIEKNNCSLCENSADEMVKIIPKIILGSRCDDRNAEFISPLCDWYGEIEFSKNSYRG